MLAVNDLRFLLPIPDGPATASGDAEEPGTAVCDVDWPRIAGLVVEEPMIAGCVVEGPGTTVSQVIIICPVDFFMGVTVTSISFLPNDTS